MGTLVALAGPMVMATLMAFLCVSLRTNQLVAGSSSRDPVFEFDSSFGTYYFSS